MIQAIESKCDVCKMVFSVLLAVGSVAHPVQYCPFCGVTIDGQHLVVLEEDTVSELESSANDLLATLPFQPAAIYEPSADRLDVLLENVVYVEQAACRNVILYRAKDDRRIVGFSIVDAAKVIKYA